MTFDPTTDPNNIGATALGGTTFATLDELRASAQFGDGNYPTSGLNPPFGPWQYVLVDDGTQAYYDAAADVWVTGAAPPAPPYAGAVVATLTALKARVGAPTNTDDTILDEALAAASSWVYDHTMRCSWDAPDLQEAVLKLASRIYSRRRSPDGSAGFGPDGAVVRVLARDPDVATLLERHLDMGHAGIG